MVEPWYNESLYINETPLKQVIFLPSLQNLQNAIFFCQATYIITLVYLDCYSFFFIDTQPSGGFSDSQDKEIFEGILSLTNLRAF